MVKNSHILAMSYIEIVIGTLKNINIWWMENNLKKKDVSFV